MRTPLRTALLLALSVTVAVGVGSSTAQARGWSDPHKLVGKRQTEIGLAGISAGPQRYAVAAFTRAKLEIVDLSTHRPRGTHEARRFPNGSVLARTRDSNGKWGRLEVISGSTEGNYRPVLSTATTGATVLAWVDSQNRVVASLRDLHQNWSSPRVLTPSLSSLATVPVRLAAGISPSGRATVAWVVGQPGSGAAVGSVSFDGAGGPTTIMAHAKGIGVGFQMPAVSVSATGRASVLWAGDCRPDRLPDPAGLAVSNDGATSWGAAQPVPGSECAADSNYAVGLSSSSDGGLAAIFGGALHATHSVRLATGDGSGLGPAVEVNGSIPGGYPRIDSDDGSRLIAVWRARAGIRAKISSRVFSADGQPMSGVRKVSEVAVRSSAELAAGEGGGIAAWQSRGHGRRISAAVLAPGATRFERPFMISGRLPDAILNTPEVAASPSGRVYVAWSPIDRRLQTHGTFITERRVNRPQPTVQEARTALGR